MYLASSTVRSIIDTAEHITDSSDYDESNYDEIEETGKVSVPSSLVTQRPVALV